MVYAGGFKFRHIFVHALHNLVVVLSVDLGVIHIPPGKLLGENFIKDVVLVVGDGFVDAALGVGTGGDDGSVPDLAQGRGQGEDLAFQIIVILEAILASGGIENPVADIYKIQQASEFLLAQVDLHDDPPLHTHPRCRGFGFHFL